MLDRPFRCMLDWHDMEFEGWCDIREIKEASYYYLAGGRRIRVVPQVAEYQCRRRGCSKSTRRMILRSQDE